RGGGQEVGATLDDLRVYNRPLSPDEVNRLYHLGATTKINKTITPADLDTDLELHFTFDGPDYDRSQTSAEARDRSGNNNHGDARFDTTLDVGRIGQGARFDGDQDYIHVADNSTLDLSSSFTIATWFRLTGQQQPDWIDFVNKGSTYYLGIQVTNGEMYFGWSGHEVRSDYTGPWTDEWFHVVGVFDDAGNTIKLYINGEEDASVSETGSVGTSSNPLTVGTWDAGGDSSEVNGVMDDVRVYSRALTPEEVQRLYQMG